LVRYGQKRTSGLGRNFALDFKKKPENEKKTKPEASPTKNKNGTKKANKAGNKQHMKKKE